MLPDFIDISPMIRIPVAELEFRFVRSSGPGGQNVNKLSTKVELYFDVTKSPSISTGEREYLLTKLASQIDASGNIRVVSQTERSQLANRIKAIQKLETLLQNALKRPKKRTKTKPTRRSKEERIHAKKIRSAKIQNRNRKKLLEDQ